MSKVIVQYLEDQLRFHGFNTQPSWSGEFQDPKGNGEIHTRAWSYETGEDEISQEYIYIYSGLGDVDSYAYPVKLKSKEQVDALLIGLGIKE